ncbi:unnamed protein product [Cylicostephanus goldi]|uniref:Solute carrier family 25 member 40 n=1 Tax=Cylicostephanus goldi TaxID=71465 RepID=A0A3P7MMM0_CYLGO|nr:unnamed protein product [Cylicostephanus goldi]
MDVVKIRLQQQHHPFPKGQCFYFYNGLMEHVCTACEHRQPCVWYQRPGNFSGTIDAFVKITREEGIKSLWSGLSPTLVMAIPATVFYYSLYDTLYSKFMQRCVASEFAFFSYYFHLFFNFCTLRLYRRRTLTPELWCPPEWTAATLAGATARTSAATIVSPLEMIRTKMQSEQLTYRDIGRALRVTVAKNGIRGFYLGWMPTLLRDIPFSAIYWAFYQYFKRNLLEWRNMERTTFATAFACGATSGTIAAIITTPFDVVRHDHISYFIFIFFRFIMKTHLQIKLGQENAVWRVPTKKIINEIMENGGGVRALFAGFAGILFFYFFISKFEIVGVVPRVVKIAPSCAVMIGSYEYFKGYFARRNQRHSLSQ